MLNTRDQASEFMPVGASKITEKKQNKKLISVHLALTFKLEIKHTFTIKQRVHNYARDHLTGV